MLQEESLYRLLKFKSQLIIKRNYILLLKQYYFYLASIDLMETFLFVAYHHTCHSLDINHIIYISRIWKNFLTHFLISCSTLLTQLCIWYLSAHSISTTSKTTRWQQAWITTTFWELKFLTIPSTDETPNASKLITLDTWSHFWRCTLLLFPGFLSSHLGVFQHDKIHIVSKYHQ